MAEPRNYQTEAIIIKKTKLGEADRILTMLTPRLGKIQAVAKGVRRPKSKMAGHLELLTYSKVALARGRNLSTVTGSQTINAFLPLKDDLMLSTVALYAVELVNLFTADEQENNEIFDLLLETLEQIVSAPNKELVLRYFELRLLDLTGYRPELMICLTCRQPLTPVVNCFSPSSGGMLCPVCGGGNVYTYQLSVNAQKVLRLMQKTDYATLNRLKVDGELGSELKTVLGSYIRYLLERDVKSAEFLDSLRSQIAQL